MKDEEDEDSCAMLETDDGLGDEVGSVGGALLTEDWAVDVCSIDDVVEDGGGAELSTPPTALVNELMMSVGFAIGFSSRVGVGAEDSVDVVELSWLWPPNKKLRGPCLRKTRTGDWMKNGAIMVVRG